MGHLLGYARVSTTDQQPQFQVDALEHAGCYRVFTETASGARADRPTLTQLLDQLRPGDTLVVWKLDRLGRSLRHLVDTVTNLADRGIGFRSLQEAIDTTTPGGKLVFHVFAALAEFERDLIRERTTAGLAAARARGRPPRPPLSHDRPQAPSRSGDVQLWAVHSGGNRHDARGQPRLDLPPSHPDRQLKLPAARHRRPEIWPPASTSAEGYLSVWSSISALGAFRLTDSMPLTALALLS
jgi:DNA invertase Pin-like site-specific DNA recombinase